MRPDLLNAAGGLLAMGGGACWWLSGVILRVPPGSWWRICGAGCSAAGWGFWLARDLADGHLPWSAADAVIIAVWLLMLRKDWRNRRRRRAMEALGARSRALRDKLVRRARETARPSPVLRPSLRGTR